MKACIVNWLCRDYPERGTYKNSMEAFLTQVAYTIGLGNFWRFPYLCNKYHGTTFVFAYGICMMSVGLPLYLLELSLGQYVGRGPAHMFSYMCPLLSGVGWAMVLMLFMISIYYNIVLSWSLFYTGASILKSFPWLKNETNIGGHSIRQHYEDAKEHFLYEVLGKPREGEKPYELQLWLVLCLAVAWLVVCVCLALGTRRTGKIFYVTVIYPYIILLLLFAMNFQDMDAKSKSQLERKLTEVHFDKLQEKEIWVSAVSQVIYSLGIGNGVMMVGSHNQPTHNVVRDTFVVCFLDVITSVLCASVFFSLTVSFDPYAIPDSNDTSTLVFILYPAMLSRSSTPLWAVLFFVMIFALGFDSLLVMVKTITTTIFDQSHNLRPYHPIIIVLTCTVFFLLGLPMCIREGITVFEVMNDYTAKHSFLLISLLEVLIASYFFGCSKVLKLMKDDLQAWVPLPFRWYLTLTWSYITPLCLLGLCVLSLFPEGGIGPEDQNISFYSGQVIAFAPIALVPIFAVYVSCTNRNKSIKELVSATPAFETARFREGGREPVIINGGVPMQNFAYQINGDETF